MHPDKTDSQSDKKLYTLLTSISTILKDPVSRTIYDAHLQKGIPVWRGTGYYYAKFKPGLGFVSVFLLLVASFVQYVSAWLIWWRNSRQLAEQENIYDGLTSTQLKKGFQFFIFNIFLKYIVLKKNGIESDLKNPSGSQVAELIKSASSESLNIDVGGVQKPSIFGVLIFTLPIAIVKLPFTLMSRKKKEKEEEIVEEVVEVVKSERKGKGGKRRINGKQAKSITELKEQMSK